MFKGLTARRLYKSFGAKGLRPTVWSKQFWATDSSTPGGVFKSFCRRAVKKNGTGEPYMAKSKNMNNLLAGLRARSAELTSSLLAYSATVYQLTALTISYSKSVVVVLWEQT
jgi:hypothetical protein